MKRFSILLAMAFVAVACVKPENTDQDIFIQTPHKVSGKAEKGPMVKGSSIELRTMTKELLPDGSSYSTTITSDDGNFDFGDLQLTSPFAKLTADGYFFNEVQGGLSNGTIKIESIVDLADNTTINVNLLTHLKSQRIIKLVSENKISFEQANQQAQKELMSEFGFQNLNLSSDVSQFSISGGDDASAALIAVSSLILGNRKEAAIVELLSALTSEFGESGKFSTASRSKFESSMDNFRDKLDIIADNVKNRYSQLGKEVEVKDLAYYFDWDGDGVAGNEIPTEEVTLSQSEIHVPIEGGSYSVTLNFDRLVLYRLNENPEDDNPISSINPSFSLYEPLPTKSMQLEKKIEGKTLTVIVSPAEFCGSELKTIEIYDYIDRKVAELNVIQDGNPVSSDIPNLSEEGKELINSIMSLMSETLRKADSMERSYLISSPIYPYTPSDSNIGSLWSQFYSIISRLCQVKQSDAEQRVVYQHLFDACLATCYLYMISDWGDVPFYIMPLTDHTGLLRTSVSEICSTMAERISPAFDKFEDKKFNWEDGPDNQFFIPRDVAKLIVAKLHLMNKEYSTALDIYKEIIDNGRYALTEGDDIVYGPSSELIFAFLTNNGTRASLTIMEPRGFDLKDVILDAAECALMSGEVTVASKYLTDFCSKKNFEVPQTCDIEKIGELRKKIMSPFLMPFLYRNNLENLVSAERYQLLWPIPNSEIICNPYITQNPGY